MIDEVDVGHAVGLGIEITHGNLRPVIQVNKAAIPVVGSQVKMVEEVGSEYRLADVGYYEREIESAFANADLTVG